MEQTTSWPVGRYRLLTQQYLSPFPGAAPRLMNAGEEVVLTIAPNLNLEPLDAGARAGMEAYKAAKAEQAAESRRIEAYRRQGYALVPAQEMAKAPPAPEPPPPRDRFAAAREAKARKKAETLGHDMVPEGDQSQGDG